jgi:hypothetical protein
MSINSSQKTLSKRRLANVLDEFAKPNDYCKVMEIQDKKKLLVQQVTDSGDEPVGVH